MCFSAEASFAAAAATGLAGAVMMTRVSARRDWALAGIPLVFALQQAMEAGLWLGLEHQAPAYIVPLLANAFAAVALILWPLYSPFAIGLAETQTPRLGAMALLMGCGAVVAVYSVVTMMHHPYAASVQGSSLCYVNKVPFPPALFAAYALATCGPALVSSHRALRAFGVIVVCGALVSATLYYVAFLSVWCFFAAAASVTIGAYFANRTGAVTERPSPYKAQG